MTKSTNIRALRTATMWLAAVCVWLCTGCSSHDSDSQEPGEPGVDVYFRLVTDGGMGLGRSRASMGDTWHSTDDLVDGNDFENAINTATFYLSAKKGSVEQLATLVPLMVRGPETNPVTGEEYYECVGRVKSEDLSKLTGAKCRLTAMVNAPAPQSMPTTMQQLSKLTYEVEPYGHSKAYLPMWGVTTFDFPAINAAKGQRVTLPRALYLLRAVAKIEVVLNMNDPDTDPRSFQGTGAYFDCEDASGAFTPGKNYMTPCLDHGYVMAIGGVDAEDTRDLNMYHTVATMPSAQVTKMPQHTIDTSTPRQQKLEFYVPPYQPSRYANLTVTYPQPNPYEADAGITGYLPQVRVTLNADGHDAVSQVVTLDYAELSGIEAGSLQRNHLYRITLNRMGVAGLRFGVTIADMVDGGTIELEYDEGGNGGADLDDGI